MVRSFAVFVLLAFSSSRLPAAESVPEGAASGPGPMLSTPEASKTFGEGLEKLSLGDYSGARAAFGACLKNAVGPGDREVLMELITDTKLGSEIEMAERLVERKEERRAIVMVQKALKTYPGSRLRPLAERFIERTEELIFLILDDFEPGESLQRETAPDWSPGDETAADPRAKGAKGRIPDPAPDAAMKPAPRRSGRWSQNHRFNGDPRFVQHGKGSLAWTLANDIRSGGTAATSYRSTVLPHPITRWRTLLFWVYQPQPASGSIQVTLAPDGNSPLTKCLYSEKFIELKGYRVWLEVRLDLKKDFGNTRFVKLDDMRCVRISSTTLIPRTIYLDFVHLE
jgi:hypothetical protein